MENDETVKLSELSSQKRSFKAFLRAKCPYLFDPRSTFYFAIGLALIGFLWMAYSLVYNSFTQLYGWDYSSQFVTMAYGFHDTWQNFFKTGYFELYSTNTYIGVDQIGANAYYGLFDPFLLFAYIVTPRSWIPQMFAILTVAKGVVGGLSMRWYCRYLGMKEASSRVAGLAFAFNGYINFMVGFPSTVSAAVLIPLVLLGIEKVLKERRPYLLAISLFLMGMTSFFFLVVICIFGAFYAMVRFFMTFKDRDRLSEHFSTIGLGVLGFAAGIMLGSWVLFPSLRESVLSGRTASIGALYLDELLSSIKNFDVGSFFASMFQMVGNHPIREMQGITSFLFPTCNYLWLPLARPTNGQSYDAWTASLFSYTPIVILFFIALVSAIRRKKIGELLLFALFSYLVFTNFAYYAFYAFAGDGYGRWYIALLPIIIYYGARELDRIREEPHWVVATGCVVTLALSVLVWCLYALYFNGMYFEIPEGQKVTYWVYRYAYPGYGERDGIIHSLSWMVYYQFFLYGTGSVLFLLFRNRKWLSKALMGMIAVETIVSGNCSFIYGSSWSYERNYNGGAAFANAMTERMEKLNEIGDGYYYRVNIEGLPDKNSQIAFGVNGTSHFDSLFNYETAALNSYSRLDTGGWSAFYNNKRIGLDTAFGLRYYAVKSEGYGGGYDFAAPNVPFDSSLVYEDDAYQIYESGLSDDLYLSWMSGALYKENANPGTSGTSIHNCDFYHSSYGSGNNTNEEIMRNEEVYLTGSIIKDEDVERAEKLGLAFESAPSYDDTVMGRLGKAFSYTGLQKTVYKTVGGYSYYGTVDGKSYGPSDFLNPEYESVLVSEKRSYNLNEQVQSDYEKIVLTPRSGEFFNDDKLGAYFALYINESAASGMGNVRVYMIGDRYDEDGNLVKAYDLLSYEYKTIADYNSMKVNSNGSLFGFYPEGKVRAIVFLGKPSERAKYFLSSTFYAYMLERSDVESMLGLAGTSKLENVVYTTDRFDGDLEADRDGIMNTVLAYDAGWHVYLQGEEETVEAETFNVNGGFLGYFVPKGNWHVVISYQTPYLELASVFYSVGFFSLVAVFLGKTYLSYRKIKKGREAQASA